MFLLRLTSAKIRRSSLFNNITRQDDFTFIFVSRLQSVALSIRDRYRIKTSPRRMVDVVIHVRYINHRQSRLGTMTAKTVKSLPSGARRPSRSFDPLDYSAVYTKWACRDLWLFARPLRPSTIKRRLGFFRNNKRLYLVFPRDDFQKYDRARTRDVQE